MSLYANRNGSTGDSDSLTRDSFALGDEMQLQDMEPISQQQQRLLPDDTRYRAKNKVVESEEKWHLRPWVAIMGSILVMWLASLGLQFFAKHFIAKGIPTRGPQIATATRGFRRPESDYVLDPRWGFHDAPKIREFNWTIMDITANPDGVFRRMLTIDGQFPGPMIECNEGDTVVVNVENQSVDSTTLHFHGIFQNGTNWMDGAPGVTQCPISPKRSFQYRFTITGQSGTYFYHGHTAAQASDGLFGPLVVHSKDEKSLQRIPYTSDRVVMLQDYYHEASSGLLFDNLSPGKEGSPVPDGALINGLNQRPCSGPSRKLCDNSTTTLSTMDLSQNANHRLRFINVGVLAYFHVSIDAHKLAITEADGTDLIPLNDTKLIIGPAQRYSAVITTDQQDEGDSFWVRARMMMHCMGESSESAPAVSEVRGIIRYKSRAQNSANYHHPTSVDWNQDPLQNCTDHNSTFIPSLHNPPPEVATKSYYLTSNIEIGDWRLERGVFNTSSFHPDLQVPTLHHTIAGLHNPDNQTFFTDGVNSRSFNITNNLVIQHSSPETINLIIRNFDENPHPMHLHGHKFWILGAGHGPFPGYKSLGLKPEGKGLLTNGSDVLDNLLRRDVATLEGFGWLALRFVADNPGVWAFHCHMAWHSEKGLGMQFLSGVEEMRGWSLPDENRKLCESTREELEKGARPMDDIWVGDLGENDQDE